MAVDASRRQTLLLLRAQSGDQEALDHLLKGVQERLYTYLRGLVGDPHLAEDVLQDVFVLVYRKLLWLRDPELFRPWVHRIATREAFRQIRRRRRREELLAEDGRQLAAALPRMDGADAPDAPRAELVERLPQLVQAVSPASRAVLLPHYFEGMKLDEVAAVLGLSVGTVKSRLHYGLNLLRETLGPGAPGTDGQGA